MAVTFALTFAGHRFVPDWTVALTLSLGVVTLIVASLWSWQARRLLLAHPARDERNAETRTFAANSRLWWITALASTLSLIGLATFLVIAGLRPNPSFASPYDGTDPGTSPCVDSAHPVLDQGRPVLRDPAGKPVGYVQLVRSVACATLWARIMLQHSSVRHLRGDIALITMVRPGDSAKAVYPLLLYGGTIGFGNMLSDSQSCVIAQVRITSAHDKSSGPEIVTDCR